MYCYLTSPQAGAFEFPYTHTQWGFPITLTHTYARLDASSHDQVQSAIRSHFRGCTIIMVAHRLDSLLDFDRVVVLDAGRVVEYDNPRVLLADSNSAFAKLFRSGRGS